MPKSGLTDLKIVLHAHSLTRPIPLARELLLDHLYSVCDGIYLPKDLAEKERVLLESSVTSRIGQRENPPPSLQLSHLESDDTLISLHQPTDFDEPFFRANRSFKTVFPLNHISGRLLETLERYRASDIDLILSEVLPDEIETQLEPDLFIFLSQRICFFPPSLPPQMAHGRPLEKNRRLVAITAEPPPNDSPMAFGGLDIALTQFCESFDSDFTGALHLSSPSDLVKVSQSLAQSEYCLDASYSSDLTWLISILSAIYKTKVVSWNPSIGSAWRYLSMALKPPCYVEDLPITKDSPLRRKLEGTIKLFREPMELGDRSSPLDQNAFNVSLLFCDPARQLETLLETQALQCHPTS